MHGGVDGKGRPQGGGSVGVAAGHYGEVGVHGDVGADGAKGLC